jgi:hypothetical protein
MPRPYVYVPVNTGAHTQTAKTRAGQRATSPHSSSATDAKRAAEAATETTARATLPTSAAGRYASRL